MLQVVLATATAALPFLSPQSFPELTKRPATLSHPALRQDLKVEAPSLSPSAASSLLSAAERFKAVGPIDPELMAGLKLPAGGSHAWVFPVGRFRVGGCTGWLAAAVLRPPDGGSVSLLLFTSKGDAQIVDAAVLGNGWVVPGHELKALSAKLTVPGEIEIEERSTAIPDADPTSFSTDVDSVHKSSARIDEACHATVTQAPRSPFSGALTDSSTGEWLKLADTGDKVMAWYSNRRAPWVPLVVEAVNRDAGTLAVRFKPGGAAFPLSVSSAENELLCTNPDGGVQHFRRERPPGQ